MLPLRDWLAGRTNPPGIFIEKNGSLLRFGDVRCLLAAYVNDLSIHRDERKIVMEWTRPCAVVFDLKDQKFKPMGSSVKRKFIYDDSPC
jgi:hypothetical protein